MYDKDLYLEPDCVNGAVPLPVHCNYMGLGQECRGCYMTCEGVERYMEDFADEIEEWVSMTPNRDVRRLLPTTLKESVSSRPCFQNTFG